MNSTNEWAWGRGRDVMKTLLLALLVFLGLGAKKAEANITTEIDYYNNTGATLTLVGVTNWGSQRWISTNPAGGNNPVCATASPPQTIAPGQSGCFYSEGTNLFVGTGGTITYTVTPVQEYGSNGNPIQTDPLSVAWTWSTPFFSEGPVSAGNWSASATLSETVNGGPPFGSINTGPIEEGFATSSYIPNGNYVQFGLIGSPPTDVEFASEPTGKAGAPFTISGSGFVPGITQILFGSEPAINITCTSTECQGEAPENGSVIQGSVNVQVGVAGNFAEAGSFYYYLAGPGCSYSWVRRGKTLIATTFAQCPNVQPLDSVEIYESTGSNTWTAILGYPVGAGTPGPLEDLTEGPAAGTLTFMACEYTAGGFTPSPGENGCDEPITLTL